MSKKENEREVTNLLARIRESLKRPKKESEDRESSEDSFDRELSERLEKHLNADKNDADLREGETESDFAVEELEIVEDGVLNPTEVEQSLETAPDEETVSAAEQALFSDLDALMARMTPEQRALFEAEMNAADEVDEEIEISEVSENTECVEEDEVPEQSAEPQEKTMEEVAEEAILAVDAYESSPSEEASEEITSMSNDEAREEIPAEESEIYVSPDEDEEYDLPEAEVFRALEARMTPEQRAQFEQALAEAQEAERALKAERAACREAERLAVEQAAGMEQESESENIPTAAPSENAETEIEVVEDAVISETVSADEETLVEEDTLALTSPSTENADQSHIQIAPSDEQEDLSSGTAIFMAANEDDFTDGMRTIKIGSDPSTFTLVVEPEPESEPDLTEEEALASLLARMSPEQLARFREEMLADQEREEAEMEPMPAEEGTFTYAPIAEENEEVFEEVVEEPEETQEDTQHHEDAIAAVLNDPEKLEELMARLTPEQAAELRAMLGEDESEEIFVEDAPMPTEEILAPETEPDVESEPEIAAEPEVGLEMTGEFVDEEKVEFVESEILTEDDEAFFEDEEEAFAPDDTDTGVAYEFDQTEETSEDAYEDVDDMNIFEINEDMSDEEISLMLGLGYEKELTYTLGAERVEQVKKRATRENAHEPEYANAYAYEGEEYSNTDQNERIRYCYERERRRLWVRLGGTAFFALLLFLYECCGLFSGAFGDIFNAAHYPVITIMAGWQLLIFAAAFSWKQLVHGVRSAFVLEPDNHAMTAVVVVIVMFSNILMAIVFKGSNLNLYNFPAALCLLCSVLCDLADVTRERLTFDIVSSDAKKYVSEAITLTSVHTSMPIMPVEEEKHTLSSKNAMYVRRVGFVKNYFRRTNRRTHHGQILNFVFLPLIAFSAVMAVVTALIGNGIAPALNGFVVSILVCMPLSYTVIHTLPLLYEAHRLKKQGCAIVGEATVEECNQFSTVIFEDKDIFPPTLIQTKGLKLYENNLIYSVILKISLLFREIGGPINEVLDLDKEEMKRFLASGQAGELENGKVWLDSVMEDGVTARLSDGSRVVAGSASFLGAHGIHVRVSEKDQQLIDSKHISILFLAFDGKLGARFYVDYQPDPEFEALVGMLHEDGFRVAVRTLDPGIHEEMITRKCAQEMPAVGTVRAQMREITSKLGSDARVDGGLVCSDDPRRMLLPLRAIRNLRRLNRFSLRLYAIALLINMAVVVVLTACSVVGFMSSLFVSLYMLVWLATSLAITALFLNK